MRVPIYYRKVSMTISRVSIIIFACLFMTGCVPILGSVGSKGIVMGLVTLVGIVAAAWGFTTNQIDDRIAKKAEILDAWVDSHEDKYHNKTPPS
jgi:hypothetical protein